MATLGYTSVGGTTYNIVASEAILIKVSLGAAGDVTEVQAYVRAQAGTGNVKGIIYQDNSDAPGALVGVGAAVAIDTTQAWKASALVVNGMAAGTYWVGLVCDVAATIYYDASPGQGASSKTALTYASPADPMGAESTNLDGNIASVYATYTQAPTIDTQPTDQRGNVGSTATFTIAATTSGGTLHYQWKDDGSNVGTDSNSYTTGTLVNGDQKAQITCDVSDDNGTRTSSAATLTIAFTVSGTGPRRRSILGGFPIGSWGALGVNASAPPGGFQVAWARGCNVILGAGNP